MHFPLHFQSTNPALAQIQLEPGEMLFVLGANGVGKSSLMHRISTQNDGHVRKIAAHRQTWMSSDALDMTPAQKLHAEQQMRVTQNDVESRYKDRYGNQRASMTVYELIDAENVRAREITALVDLGKVKDAAKLAEKAAPTTVINELLRLSNIPIEISIHANEKVMASKDGGPLYSAAQLSDGERNALLIAGAVLTAPTNNLIIIDEPERHLHRSIISPLLTQLFDRRRDCAFVISTHDHDLPLENPSAKTLLIRTCNFNGQAVQNWEVDELRGDVDIDDILKRDLLGARRKILFVEGTESSLDKPLYSLIFPQVSVIPKGSCREVEQAVYGVVAGEQFHWLRAFGIIDGDGYDDEAVAEKLSNRVYALPYYSIEAIYFHPRIIEMVAGLQARVSGDEPMELTAAALTAGIKEVRDHAERLCGKAVKKAVEKAIWSQLPNGDQYLNGVSCHINVDSESLLAKRTEQLIEALDDEKWEAVLSYCPIRECGARNQIATALNFRSFSDYQKAVQNLLANDADALKCVRSLFTGLYAEISE